MGILQDVEHAYLVVVRLLLQRSTLASIRRRCAWPRTSPLGIEPQPILPDSEARSKSPNDEYSTRASSLIRQTAVPVYGSVAGSRNLRKGVASWNAVMVMQAVRGAFVEPNGDQPVERLTPWTVPWAASGEAGQHGLASTE